jgi:alpha-glucosidase
MTDWTPRAIDVELGFLGGGSWEMTAFADGPDANDNAQSYKRTVGTVDKTTRLRLGLAPGGGFAARITPRSMVPKR